MIAAVLRVVRLVAVLIAVRGERAPRGESTAAVHAYVSTVVALAVRHGVGMVPHQVHLECAVLGGGVLAVRALERLLPCTTHIIFAVS